MSSAPPYAQVSREAAPEKQTTISVDVSLINVFFTVTDRKGKSIRNLKQENFKIFEDGRAQTITNFSAEANLPLVMALLIDTSGSVRDRLHFEQNAAVKFFQSTLVPDKDRAIVIAFDSTAAVLQDYTDDIDLLARAVKKMRAGGGTSFYDAVYAAATQKLAAQDGRRIMVVVTDGDDTSSRSSITEALEAAQKNDVIIYAISTNSSAPGGDRSQKGDDALKKLAESTGGRVFFPLKASQLESNFNDIRDELRFQYTLAYSPTNVRQDGTFRHIRIETSDKRHIVRAREGYFAPNPPVSGQVR
jgi:VWFA-related protein